LSIVAMPARLVVFEPCGFDMSKRKLTVPPAVTRTALGTDVEVTVWMAPLLIGVAIVVKVVPLSVPRSTVSLEKGTLLRVALFWTATTTAPLDPDTWVAVWPLSARAVSMAISSAWAWRVRLLSVTRPMSTARAVAPIVATMATQTTTRTAPASSPARRWK
jgi:hypothetical protein